MDGESGRRIAGVGIGYDKVTTHLKIFPFKISQADRGCAAVAFFVEGGGGVWAKKVVTLRGLRISEKK